MTGRTQYEALIARPLYWAWLRTPHGVWMRTLADRPGLFEVTA